MTSKPRSRSSGALIGVAMLTACGGGGGTGYGSSPEPIAAPPPAPFVVSGTVPTFLDQGTEGCLIHIAHPIWSWNNYFFTGVN